MTRVLLLVTSLLFSLTAMAQKGIVKGTVKDAETGEEIIGASVMLGGTTTGANTNVFGEFEFSATPGTYELVSSYVGYQKFAKSITVTEGQTTNIQVLLSIDAQELMEVEVVGKANKEAAEALMVERQNADVMIQSIGAQEMSAKGISNVEGAMTKVTGISKVGSKGLFVRGLGDRYNNALLNGLPVPATNPDKKMIDLSIFPSDLVKNLNVNKTFSPNLYGDFAGATVNIMTKDYSEEPFFKIGVGAGMNSLATGLYFRHYSDGDNEYAGFSGYGRKQSTVVKANTEGQDVMSTSWDSKTKNAPLNQNFNVSGGNYFDVGEEGGFGFIASVAYDNDYEYRDGVYRNYQAQGRARVNYDATSFRYNTTTSGLLNFYYKINNRHSFNFNNIYVNESQNRLDEYFGNNAEYENLYSFRNTYTQNKLQVHQLLGDHSFMENDKLKVNWGVSYARTTALEPDRKQLIFDMGQGKSYNEINWGDGRLYTDESVADNHRFWSEMDENAYAANLEAELGLGEYNGDTESYRSTLKLGYQGNIKEREFNYDQINIRRASGNADGINVLQPNEDLNSYLSAGSLVYEPYNIADTYFDARQDVHAAFVGYGYEVIPSKLKVNAGVRAEIGEQSVNYRTREDGLNDPYRNETYNSTEILPSLSAKYSINDASNVRFAASKTITRPGMRELSPFEYQEAAGGASVIGNPALINSENYNVDLKYEIFPNRGELISVGVFGKQIQDPIERIAIASSSQLYTFENVGSATVAGVEVEFNKRLSNLFQSNREVLTRTKVGINATYMYSEIDLSGTTTTMTNTTREMQGASPFLINADLGYEADLMDGNVFSNFALTYSIFGDRIFAAGVQGAGDIYERSYGTLNFIWKNKIKDRLSVDFSVKNILNPEVTREQEFTDGEVKVVNAYQYGINGGVSISYTF
ncbi:TonB-dependent receptor [Limibacter armeniacum]|uniref:TonB-dependent receptor n=1 Tax=Limibacter armeniacum TaxID=466084 RepID=UPI002FE55A55